MKNYRHKRADGTIVSTRFHNNKSYTKEYANMNEYNRENKQLAISIWKILFAPIYYPVMFMYKTVYFLFKSIYWDLPRFIYGKIKK